MAEQHDINRAWKGHPRLALLLRVVILLFPLAASAAVTIVISRVWPAPESVGHLVGWWVLVSLIGMAVCLLVDRLGRRILPLTALLKLALVFPDQAPSRFGVALRSGTTRQLQRRAQERQCPERARPAHARALRAGAGLLPAHRRGARARRGGS
ncbi:MAG: hypothetical protein K0R11_2054 [Acidimicrobiales bacterium]|nr:hypothetical protein [Acidimicrobiales bacterium]